MVDRGITGSKKSCNHKIITDDVTGELICSKCGQITARNQILHKRNRIFLNGDTSTQRTGPPLSFRMADMGLSTTIGYGNYKKKIKPAEARRVNRLRFWDARIKSGLSSERSLKKGLLQIETLRGKLCLPDNIVEHAAKILRNAQKQKLAVGRDMTLLATASLYAACRAGNVPRNLTEVSKIANVNRKALSKMYRILSSSLELKYEPFDPSKFIGKLASKLNIDGKTQRDAIVLLDKASKKRITVGKRPAALASAALYFACKRNCIKLSQERISDVSKISPPTIKKICKILSGM